MNENKDNQKGKEKITRKRTKKVRFKIIVKLHVNVTKLRNIYKPDDFLLPLMYLYLNHLAI